MRLKYEKKKVAGGIWSVDAKHCERLKRRRRGWFVHFTEFSQAAVQRFICTSDLSHYQSSVTCILYATCCFLTCQLEQCTCRHRCALTSKHTRRTASLCCDLREIKKKPAVVSAPALFVEQQVLSLRGEMETAVTFPFKNSSCRLREIVERGGK